MRPSFYAPMTGVPSFIGTIHLIRTLSYARPPPAAPAKRVSWGMKRADLLDNLAHVERHVRDGERHLLRQREIAMNLSATVVEIRKRQKTRGTLKWHSRRTSMIARISYLRCGR